VKRAALSISILLLVNIGIADLALAARRRAVRQPSSPVLRFTPASRATVAQRSELNQQGPMTVEAWVYQTGDLATGHNLILSRDQGGNQLFSFAIGAPPGQTELLRFHLIDGAGQDANLVGKEPLSRFEWTHIACTFDSSTAKCWMGGVSQGTIAISGPPRADASTGPLQLGSDGSGFAGAIRDVRIWNRALAESEIQRIARREAPSSLEGILAHWPMRDGSGQSVADAGPHRIPMFLGLTDQFEGLEPSWMKLERIQEGPYFEIKYMPGFCSGAQDLIAMDMSGDGMPDLQVVGHPSGTPICTYPYYPGQQTQSGAGFRAAGSRSFELSSLVEWEMSGWVWKHHVADLTGDGRNDVFLLATGPELPFYDGVDCGPPGADPSDIPGGQSRILVRKPDGGLREETTARLPRRLSYDFGTAIADFDGDIDLDVFLLSPVDAGLSPCVSGVFATGAPCPVILVNDGRGVFTEDFTRLPRLVSTGLDGEGGQWTFWTALAADVDRDGDSDIVVGRNPQGTVAAPTMHLLVNDGAGRFALAAYDTFPPQPVRNEPPYFGPEWMVAADFDGDGWTDIFEASSNHGESRLYLNNGSGKFRDASGGLPLEARTFTAWRCEAADLNADHAPDIVCMDRCTGPPYEGFVCEQPIGLLYNRGDGTFDQMPDIDGFGFAGLAYTADADGDGDLDIFGDSGGICWVAYQKKPYYPSPKQ